MVIKLNFELKDGTVDSLTLPGSIEYIRKQAAYEKNRRGAVDAWSEVISE